MRIFVASLIVCAFAHGADGSIQPFLAKYCVSCHGAKTKMAALDLQHPPESAWEKVLERLAKNQMPPAGAPQPSAADREAAIAAIEKALPGSNGPLKVTARRLNRAEYNNTVRDLLGVALRPANEFPMDDAGYGFDNIGDVLSVSPLLMEKYMAAARKLSHAAIYGEKAPPVPGKLIRYMTKKSQDDPTPNALPFSNRGAIYGSFRFPVNGTYEFRMRVGNYRPRTTGTPRQKELSRKRGLTAAEQAELDELNRLSYPPVKMVMTVDGAEVLSEIVEGNIDYKYAHGESIARMKLTAGEHPFRASFPEFAAMPDPLDNLNTDGRRKLFIDYVDIVGPFEAQPAPPASRKQIFVCEQQTADCALRIIANLARRAFRRPVDAAELDPLVRLAAKVRDSGDSFEESVRVALQAILVSPNFLFRTERDPERLSSFDLASRLSYFLWNSMPDEELLRAAAEDTLPATLGAQVRRMLADPKSDALVENFAGQWLGLRLLDRRKPDPATFPLADDELLDAMRRETFLFARAVMREDRSVLDFIDGPFTYLNGMLARYYGIEGAKGEAFERVELRNAERGGVMTHASVLTVSSYATRTSPVLRGKWVMENLLGTPPPPPPPDVPGLKDTNIGTAASLRERMEQHRANPACAVCHTQMDAIGFGLENYDAAGAWRTHEGKFAIDSSGKLADGSSFNGPAELKRILKAKPDLFARNLAEKMLTFALGRGVERQDRQDLDRITAKLAASGYRFSTLVTEIVNSDAFQMRRRKPEGGTLASR